MTTFLYFIASLCISLMGLVYLMVTDPKRRRVFAIVSSVRVPRSSIAGWLLVAAPLIILITSGQTSALLAWLGAVPVVAWLLAMRHPG